MDEIQVIKVVRRVGDELWSLLLTPRIQQINGKLIEDRFNLRYVPGLPKKAPESSVGIFAYTIEPVSTRDILDWIAFDGYSGPKGKPEIWLCMARRRGNGEGTNVTFCSEVTLVQKLTKSQTIRMCNAQKEAQNA